MTTGTRKAGEPRKNRGTDLDSGLPGAPSWLETLTTDVDRATTFYAITYVR